MSNNFLPTGGGYRKLKAYQIAEIICDLSVLFVKRFVPRNSRTCDQMEQAARSGKQNMQKEVLRQSLLKKQKSSSQMLQEPRLKNCCLIMKIISANTTLLNGIRTTPEPKRFENIFKVSDS